MLDKLWDKRVLLAIVLIELFIIISFLFVDTEVEVDAYQKQIEALDAKIDSLHQDNDQLQVRIDYMYEQAIGYEKTIKLLTDDLNNVRKSTNEKINSVNSFSNSELQSFFTDRYDTLKQGN